MSDIIADAIAAGQLEAARQAVVASWAGAIANFAVVVATCWIAMTASRDAARARRELELRTDRAAATALIAGIQAVEQVFDAIRASDPDEPVGLEWISSIIATSATSLARVAPEQITDGDLRLAALQVCSTVGGLQHALALSVQMGHRPTNSQFLPAPESDWLKNFADYRQTAEELLRRTRAKSRSHSKARPEPTTEKPAGV